MCVLTNTRKKHIEQNFYSVDLVMAKALDLRFWGQKLEGICNGAQSTARSSNGYNHFENRRG